MSDSHHHDHPHHSHAHGHHHHHHGAASEGRPEFLKSLRWVFFLNIGFAVFELIGGYLANSVAVMSDALHDFGDAAAIGIAWILEKKSGSRATAEYTYGYRRWSLLSSVITGTVLLVGSIFILRECVERILNPEPVVGWGMLVMAVVGISVNGWSLLQFSRSGGANERMIRLHLLEDVAGWLIVLVTGIVLQFVDWFWLDAVAGVSLSLWIIYNVVRQLVAVGAIFLQAGPVGISVPEIEDRIKADSRVEDCHHTHLWSLDGEKHILTTHVRLRADVGIEAMSQLKAEMKKLLREDFRIFEATIEFEFSNEACELPEH